jgi:hypothetical protein
LIVVLAARSAHADCAAEAVTLRTQLHDESVRLDRWRYAWIAAYGALAVGQLGLVVTKTNVFGAYDREYRDKNLLGTTQSGLGAISMVLSPSIEVPSLVADSCADATALRAARVKAGETERKSFYIGHLGNFVVNLGGSLLLARATRWQAGALAFAIGYPIGLLNTYTMPRASWHSLGIVPVPLAEGGVAIRLVGSL